MDESELIRELESQRELMIAVSTGGPRIETVNEEFRERRDRIASALAERGLDDPNPYGDLWKWYGKWSSGDLPTYQSRRTHVSDLYSPLLDTLRSSKSSGVRKEPTPPTGWPRVDRGIGAVRERLASAATEEEFQTVGLLCRETLISLAQAVYDPSLHAPAGGKAPSEADAGRMLEGFIAVELSGGANEEARRHAKAALSLAVALQHRRTATLKDAAMCAEATTAVTNLIAIVDGRSIPRAPNALRESPRLADKALFEELRKDLPSKGSISFIDEWNMAGFSFSRSALDQLDLFDYKWDDAEHEFLDPELETLRKKLHVLVRSYLQFLSLNTWPTHGDFSTVPPEWEETQPERFDQTVTRLHNEAGEIVKTHQDLFRLARKKLYD